MKRKGRWTRRAPRVAGWYWFKFDIESKPGICFRKIGGTALDPVVQENLRGVWWSVPLVPPPIPSSGNFDED